MRSVPCIERRPSTAALALAVALFELERWSEIDGTPRPPIPDSVRTRVRALASVVAASIESCTEGLVEPEHVLELFPAMQAATAIEQTSLA